MQGSALQFGRAQIKILLKVLFVGCQDLGLFAESAAVLIMFEVSSTFVVLICYDEIWRIHMELAVMLGGVLTLMSLKGLFHSQITRFC